MFRPILPCVVRIVSVLEMYVYVPMDEQMVLASVALVGSTGTYVGAVVVGGYDVVVVVGGYEELPILVLLSVGNGNGDVNKTPSRVCNNPLQNK